MAKSESTQTLTVTLATHTYPIHIGFGCLTDSQQLRPLITGHQALIVTNETVAPLYLAQVQQVLGSIQQDVVVLPDGEQHKNERSLFAIYDTLIRQRHDRHTTILALGGGVVGDIAGFAASTYQRGVRFIQLPTTLLAQIDASVGGKTAINHPLGKNLIGSFYQPHAVIADLSTLNTLPERQLRSGYAEMIKYALLAGGELLDELRGGFARANLPRQIALCCQIKAEFVQQDEQETQGVRALLNLGHTVAHALEGYGGFQRWLHGEAVAIGLYCAALLSCQLGMLSRSCLQQIEQWLHNANLPTRIPPDVDLNQLYHFMLRDKKSKNNRLHFVLIRAPGECYLTHELNEAQIIQALMDAVG